MDIKWIYLKESEFLSYITSLHYLCLIVIFTSNIKISFESYMVQILKVRVFKIPYRTACSLQKSKKWQIFCCICQLHNGMENASFTNKMPYFTHCGRWVKHGFLFYPIVHFVWTVEAIILFHSSRVGETINGIYLFGLQQIPVELIVTPPPPPPSYNPEFILHIIIVA